VTGFRLGAADYTAGILTVAAWADAAADDHRQTRGFELLAQLLYERDRVAICLSV
jgi:hypothetical protein